ncbi:MAG: SpaA isopeptide-forming pilin-related protein [Subdoligranulum sp.]
MNRTGKNTTGWARRLTALLVTACLVMAMALPVYAEVDLLPDAPDEVELLEDEPGTASGEDTVLPEQNAATPVPDAATPEPEQSAEPEQPAPTETPEPTAEPALTPEPAATATATPVPTVTPTATPEPTEQPQKMYAAKSGDNVQAVSETGVPDTYTLYFAVPNGWENYKKVKIYAIVGKNGSVNGDKKYYLEMQVADETEDGRKIYSAVLNKDDHYPYNGLGGLEFRGYENDAIADEAPTSTIIIVQVDNNNQLQDMSFNPTASNYIGGNYYDGNNGNGNKGNSWDQTKWKDYTVSHKHFAKKAMAFENKTSETLTNVKAWFYEPDKEGTLIQVDEQPISLNDIQPGTTATFKIPDAFCSFVRFTAGDNDTEEISEYYNFYNEKVTGVKQKSFQYSEDQCYCYMYNGNEDATWGCPGATRIYYDATFSKMALNGDTSDYSIPKANNKPETIYYRIKAEGKSKSGKLVKDDTNGNLYYIDIPQGYSSIIFSGEAINGDEETRGNGVSTAWLTIPTDGNNCFYADTNDDAVYTNGQRGGYWAPKGTLRDAETWKNPETKPETKVVDIASATFTEEADTKYVTSTLYDYYTDYELNGKNRDKYDRSSPAVSYRNWVPFREFDQALSDYYKTAGAKYPLYTGHFQPSYSDWGYRFDGISAALNLWGLNSDFKDENRFMAINNSTINENGNGEFYDYAYQGLVESKTSTGDATGKPLLKDTKVAEPHFDEAFLSGTNTKNAKLGNVYNNVAFPFTKRQIFNEDQGVDYWYFDSQDTTLYLKQDSKQDQYFLKSSTDVQEREKSRNLKSDSASKTITKNNETVSSYGYFPFNETATGGVASTYNYGFGTKLQMDFTLTDDGMVETKKMDSDGNPISTNIKFFFSGDDDVWVFIDGQLALDVGGAHGKVSGLLEFGATDDGKNSVTAYVSKVKQGGTSGSDQDKNSVKSVTYNGEPINFYAQGTTLPLDKGKKHTLTMYYMERGMWESNMAVAFNFPDNNELQVQKEVDLTNVTDDDFKNCFTGQKIFNFTIQNQATHYGTTPAADPDTGGIKPQKVDLTAESGNTFKPATNSTEGEYIFKLDTNPHPDSGQDTEQVLHWYARYTDTEPVSAARKQRYGILTLNAPINIKDNMRFLTFQVYVDSKDGGGGNLSLNNLYLELLDDKGVQKGSLGTSGINGATYGSVEVKTDKWVTVKLDLHKMKEQSGFNDKVQTIRVGDNYSRNIYFRNFTFIPKAVPSTMTGFTTDQEDIPDYGSVESGKLEKAENAQYTSTKDSDTQLVDDAGRFVLEDGETVTFSDQFRRGSYISLKEKLNESLYDTTWTVYENGQVVTSMKGDNTVKTVRVDNTSKSLDKQKDPPRGPDDGRTEVYDDSVKNDGYKVSKKPEEANTIVFRSYKDPDETSSTLTKLKVKYVNTVKTGGLKIQKKAADGEKDTIKGTYTFKVTFNDVGGEGLEKEPIIKYVEINMSDENNSEHTGTITGIPVGTRYTIEEETPEDKSRLQSVTVPPNCHSAQEIGNTMVEGVIVASEDPELTAIFTNTQRKLINIEFDKLWKDANDTVLGTTNQPNEIYIQLQRRLANSAEDAPWDVVDYPTSGSKYVTVHHTDNGWLYPFNNLDQYPVGGSADNNYIYRIVEGTVEKGEFKQAAEDGTITIDGKTYVVTAEATANSETNSETGATTTPATATDGTITGGSGKIVLTNTLQNPKFALDIIKKDAEPNNEGNEVFLKDVEFKLEKLVETTTKGEPQVETTYKFDDTNTGSITARTDENGKITNVFTNLKPGTYRLTETKAHPGYNLLAQPIVIKFTQGGKCYIDDAEVKKDDKTFIPGANNTYTMHLTVLNRKTPELPHTGADAPSLWLLIGMPLAVAGLLIFTFRYNRKGGRRH